jgi:hypothetical protein
MNIGSIEVNLYAYLGYLTVLFQSQRSHNAKFDDKTIKNVE